MKIRKLSSIKFVLNYMFNSWKFAWVLIFNVISEKAKLSERVVFYVTTQRPCHR